MWNYMHKGIVKLRKKSCKNITFDSNFETTEYIHIEYTTIKKRLLFFNIYFIVFLNNI